MDAKYTSEEFYTPNIDLDAAVLCIILLAETIKLIMFRKIRDTKPGLSTFLAITLSMISTAGLVYVLVIQHPVLKMEYMVCGVMLALLIGVLMYGFLQFTPCCKKKQNV
ncbi:uncharacterized protein [Onthophagus taurus]|uniref:uncharacterized protein n=1 Tax=Onthophagus taurus TaxID=166361 RepID=UPI0039BE42F5